VILAVAPEVYATTALPAAPFYVALTAFLVVVAVGVVRRSRVVFWLVVVAFLAGPLRVAASALQLAGAMPREGPACYVGLQAAIGVVQFAIAVVLLARRRGTAVWS
jgi:hypothetical protein